MKRIVNDNEPKKESEYIFAFDDVENSEKLNVIPLYMQTNKMSAFPRLLFLDKNATFLDLKKQIFYLGKNNIITIMIFSVFIICTLKKIEAKKVMK